MKRVSIITPFGSPFLAIFGYSSGCILECSFRGAFFLHFGCCKGPRRPKREVLEEHFGDILGAGVQSENEAPVQAGA